MGARHLPDGGRQDLVGEGEESDLLAGRGTRGAIRCLAAAALGPRDARAEVTGTDEIVGPSSGRPPRFRLENEFFREDGSLAARVTSTGGWLDLAARKLVVPPPQLLAVMNSLPRSAPFEVLPSSLKDE